MAKKICYNVKNYTMVKNYENVKKYINLKKVYEYK